MQQLNASGQLEFGEGVNANEDVSEVAAFGDRLIIGSDEPTKRRRRNLIQILDKIGQDRYKVARNVTLFKGDEMDIEDLARDGDTVYVIGSHSARRRLLDDSLSRGRNRKLLGRIDVEKARDQVFRVRLNPNDKAIAKKRISLRKSLKRQKILKPFCKIPSKENEIDIEGIAGKDGWLYAGFRGPVFRNIVGVFQ